ncbi:hypothetical protein [Paenibacillus periandrae]|uniref:hypothetical protein n=1 Tax=Paenibacillus periandrae TaxID=1761741 RepID=UPI001F093D44|nr:hypothetical protein [Paenibacillus periandrae]
MSSWSPRLLQTVSPQLLAIVSLLLAGISTTYCARSVQQSYREIPVCPGLLACCTYSHSAAGHQFFVAWWTSYNQQREISAAVFRRNYR